MAVKPSRDFFSEGIGLFNQGRYFECHEVWEEAWKRSHGAEKRFLQGLIQAAVAILHAERGNLKGAASVYAKAREKLDALPASHCGIALGEFRIALDEYFDAALNEKPQARRSRPKLRRAR
ncbi:MAG TPA: DUF309 domain-containing protein [Candidatus Binataceae bacterium]|nr:DUF309 domain-containing protein [Candidatus Binataceae bacterium]